MVLSPLQGIVKSWSDGPWGKMAADFFSPA
jgi:hypothetical protein